MAELRSIQRQLHNEINSIEMLLANFNLKCSPSQRDEIQTAFNEIDINLQIIRRANLDDYEYKKLNLILDLIEKIKEKTSENNDLQTISDSITDGLIKIRKELYFAPHLSAALEDSVTDRQSEKRKLTQLVTALGQIYMDDLEERIKKQQQAVLDTYDKIIQAPSAPAAKSIFKAGKNKLSDVLIKFITSEINPQITEESTSAIQRRR